MPKEVIFKRMPYSGWSNDNQFEVIKSDGGSSEYYDLPPNCNTLQDIIVKKDMGFTQGNIFKAAFRWEHKPDLPYNLRKIIWFAEDALRRWEAQHEQPGHISSGKDNGT